MTKHILIIKHGALGDIILATAAMKAIRLAYPDTQITLLTGSAYHALLKDCPFIDEIWLDDKPKLWQPTRLLRLIRLLGSRRFDWVYDLQTSQRSTSYFRFIKTRYYSGLHRHGSHPHDTPERTSLHTLDRLAQQLAIGGIPSMGLPDVSWLETDNSTLPDMPNRYCLLVPGGAPHRPEKRWPAEHYARLAHMLIERGDTPVLIGTKAEAEILNFIEKTAYPPLNLSPKGAEATAQAGAEGGTIINLCNQTSLAQLATLARHAVYAVGNDTGPMHLIAAAGCPSCVLFNTNASSPEKSSPKGEHVTVIAGNDLQYILPEDVLPEQASIS